MSRSTYQEYLVEIVPKELESLIPEPTQGFFRFEAGDSGKNKNRLSLNSLIDPYP